jgi:ankyrin repeat protein
MEAPVWDYARRGHTETVRALVECCADASAADDDGITPVWIVAKNGHTETVLSLVACDTDASAANNRGETPLHVAARQDDTEMIWTLLRECCVEAVGLNLNSLVWYVPSLRYTRGLGWRMHCGVEVTESSANKQHHLSRVNSGWRSPWHCTRASVTTRRLRS